MARMSKRKKEVVIAEWKSGNYTMGELAKKHKVATSSISRLLKGIAKGANADVVEKIKEVEELKATVKRKGNATEIAVLEREAKKAVELEMVKEKIKEVAIKGTLQNVVMVSKELPKKYLDHNARSTHQRTLMTAYQLGNGDTKQGSNTNINTNTAVNVMQATNKVIIAEEMSQEEAIREYISLIGS